MKVVTNRIDAEAALGRALSRHIGHTTAAYDLDRILSVLDFFQDRSSAYKEEIVYFLSDRGLRKDVSEDASSDYLDGTIAFARALGIIQQTSNRDMRLQKYGATEQGRSLLAAQKAGNADFSAFYKARVAFLADADSLAALLTYYADQPSETLFDFYVKFFLHIRARRYEWLRHAFEEPLLLERITTRLSWLRQPPRGSGEVQIERFTHNTARHHSTPRKGWLVRFGMLDRSTDRLTEFGNRALASLRQKQPYFWLGPARDVQQALRISPSFQQHGPYEDEFDFTLDQPLATQAQAKALSSSVAELMRTGFPYAKLVHATQASLQLPVEFIIYRSFTDGVRYDPIEVLKEVFQTHRERFDRLSALKGKIGFYRVK